MKDTGEIIAELAIKGAKKFEGKFGRMCDECAFKKGTEANTDGFNSEMALMCLLGSGKFHCHKHGPDGTLQDAEKMCAGYLYANNYQNSVE